MFCCEVFFWVGALLFDIVATSKSSASKNCKNDTELYYIFAEISTDLTVFNLSEITNSWCCDFPSCSSRSNVLENSKKIKFTYSESNTLWDCAFYTKNNGCTLIRFKILNKNHSSSDLHNGDTKLNFFQESTNNLTWIIVCSTLVCVMMLASCIYVLYWLYKRNKSNNRECLRDHGCTVQDNSPIPTVTSQRNSDSYPNYSKINEELIVENSFYEATYKQDTSTHYAEPSENQRACGSEGRNNVIYSEILVGRSYEYSN